MKKPDSLIAAIIVFFIALFVYTKLAGPIPLFINSIQTTKTNLFQVSGDGKATAAPDVALISFGVTKQASTVSDATSQTNAAVKNILDSIKGLVIDEKNITTTNYSVYPNYDYSGSKQTITGYTVSQNVDVKITPIEKASKALDIVTQSGADVIDGITFTFNDQTKQDLEDKARKMAVLDAKKKAQSLSSASGIHLGRIIDVQENASFPTPIRLGGGAKLALQTADSAPTQLPTGESTITTTITLSYETY